MPDFLQVQTTTPDRELALAIAGRLVEARLAACVHVGGPVTSIYQWQGQTERAEEWVCTAKCRGEQFADVERLIAELHPYEVPEIIAVPIVAGSAAYLAWLTGETGSAAV